MNHWSHVPPSDPRRACFSREDREGDTGITIAQRATMRRRTFGAAVFGSFLLAGAGHIGQARASGALVASGSATPIEQRVAVASGPDRTTLWTSLHLEADAGPVALIIPVPPGASLDVSSDAWFEALEVATAPRVLPPKGVSSTCPNSTEPGELFHVAGRVDHVSSLLPEEVQVFADGGAVSVSSEGGTTVCKVMPPRTDKLLSKAPWLLDWRSRKRETTLGLVPGRLLNLALF